MMKMPIVAILIIFLMVACANSETLSTTSPTNTLSSEVQMDYCKTPNDATYERRLNYKGLVPGQTKEKDVIKLAGKPNNTNGYIEEGEYHKQWTWDTFSIIITEGIVDEIIIESEVNQINLTLSNIINDYGCPDEIYLIDPMDENTGGLIFFFYWEIGLDIVFDGTILDYSSVPMRIIFFPPSASSDEYFSRDMGLKNILSGPVPWDTIVKIR